MSNSTTTVTWKGQTYELGEFGPADLVAFERKFNLSAGQVAGSSMRMEWLCFLVWRKLSRVGVAVGEYDDDFLDGIEALDVRDEEEPTDVGPTQPPA